MRFKALLIYLTGLPALIRSRSLWVKASAGAAVLAVLFLVFGTAFWDAFRDWLIATESGSTTIRNLGLVAAGLIALPLAIWRGLVAERQADAAQQSLRNERYQKGAEMLGNKVLSVRLGGISALHRLANEHASEYHVQIMQLFCAFVRHPTKDIEHEKNKTADLGVPQIREDVQFAMNMIGYRKQSEISRESQQNFDLVLDNARLGFVFLSSGNLAGAHLRQADLSNAFLIEANLAEAWPAAANLENAVLRGANLYDANLLGSNLSGAILFDSNLSKAKLLGTKLNNATLSNATLTDALLVDADLSGTDLSEARGLTQDQLDQARADPDNPPKLEGVLDAETGQPLVWIGGQGEPLKRPPKSP